MSASPNNNSSSTTTTAATTTLDNYFLETLMDRLQLRGPDNKPLFDKSYDDFLFSEEEDDDDDEENQPGAYQDAKQAIYKEESKLEAEIIKLILTGKGDTLKPNSGEAISLRESNICVGCHEEEEGEYVVWEWHGHIMGYTDEHGFAPEYIYGNYFQRIVPVERSDAVPVEDDAVNKGLKDLIDGAVSTNPGRILHRNLNAGNIYTRF
ncbi:uncharacterized protein LOC123889495 [Trifolium pratense]|uniref:uncharacterized protein LOC123889478 n=1 Tax=Trifolium pratense TaxID=57577 RepID=UPI001E6967F5|nr:uncharacterized protein LOC123889478 [Trifolium pratense]XP_045794803.1 uncharacterized protein LOC123889495 [Trifolium pratense]